MKTQKSPAIIFAVLAAIAISSPHSAHAWSDCLTTTDPKLADTCKIPKKILQLHTQLVDQTIAFGKAHQVASSAVGVQNADMTALGAAMVAARNAQAATFSQLRSEAIEVFKSKAGADNFFQVFKAAMILISGRFAVNIGADLEPSAVAGLNCSGSILKDEPLIYYALDSMPGGLFTASSPDQVETALTTFITKVQCLSQANVNIADQALVDAIWSTLNDVQLNLPVNPAKSEHVEDVTRESLYVLTPIILALYDRTKHLGFADPTKNLLMENIDIFKSMPATWKATTIDPAKILKKYIYIFDAKQSKPVKLNFCDWESPEGGHYKGDKSTLPPPVPFPWYGLEGWHTINGADPQLAAAYSCPADKPGIVGGSNGCIYFDAFIELALNPNSLGSGKCQLMDYAVKRKGCCDQPLMDYAAKAKKTGVITSCYFEYSPWAACQPDGTQKRYATMMMKPLGCTGEPVFTQKCTYTPPPAPDPSVVCEKQCKPNCVDANLSACGGKGSFDTGSWELCWVASDCKKSSQCVISKQSCSKKCSLECKTNGKQWTGKAPEAVKCTYYYSAWSACQSNGKITRAVKSAVPSGCANPPELSHSCVYTPPKPPQSCSDKCQTGCSQGRLCPRGMRKIDCDAAINKCTRDCKQKCPSRTGLLVPEERNKSGVLEKVCTLVSDFLIPNAYADFGSCMKTCYAMDCGNPKNSSQACSESFVACQKGCECEDVGPTDYKCAYCGKCNGSGGGGAGGGGGGGGSPPSGDGGGCKTPPCPPKCPGDPSCNSVCGNGKMESGEECDDGNLDNGDGCNDQCKKEKDCNALTKEQINDALSKFGLKDYPFGFGEEIYKAVDEAGMAADAVFQVKANEQNLAFAKLGSSAKLAINWEDIFAAAKIASGTELVFDATDEKDFLATAQAKMANAKLVDFAEYAKTKGIDTSEFKNTLGFTEADTGDIYIDKTKYYTLTPEGAEETLNHEGAHSALVAAANSPKLAKVVEIGSVSETSAKKLLDADLHHKNFLPAGGFKEFSGGDEKKVNNPNWCNLTPGV